MTRRCMPVLLLLAGAVALQARSRADDLADSFRTPPDSARPWVYWMVMDGNFGPGGITEDLEAMKQVGIGGLIFMEVDVGIPKGKVPFMSAEWRKHFLKANQEAARLGLAVTMPASPGWTGSGGPWVKPEQSMQKLVASELKLVGLSRFDGALPRPETIAGFYRDVAVLAFPTPQEDYRIAHIDEKALYHRGHFSSEQGVRSVIPAPMTYESLRSSELIVKNQIIDLTNRLRDGGKLTWDVPDGQWTILRFGHTSTGANTRPAPLPGLGLECDKLDKAALDSHFKNFLGKLMDDLGPLVGKSLTGLHIDSWEMGPQNWTARFPDEFRKRRGYDLRYYLPVMTGRVVDSLEVSERFLWDLRQTVLEMISENHAAHLAELAHAHGLKLSIEPYDGTPCDDMTYGSRADVPMGEFWSDTFTTWFSCREAVSIAHTRGKRVVPAEAFTCADGERWRSDPLALKPLGDRAFSEGINRFVIHRYAQQPWNDRWPGMTMGIYGIHYERTQTWWDLSRAWMTYLARCQFLLQQGLSVTDLCFLSPEASPQVFRPSAKSPDGTITDLPGYKLDGCTPETLLGRASVQDGRIIFPDGMSYRALVLPTTPAMTPRLLRKISELIEAGATVIGNAPSRSPSLAGYPACDQEVKRLAVSLWGDGPIPDEIADQKIGKGRLLSGARIRADGEPSAGALYPSGSLLQEILGVLDVPPDFESDRSLQFAHRRAGATELYFVSNPKSIPVKVTCRFRVAGKQPELWDPLTGDVRRATAFRQENGRTTLPLEFCPGGSLFVVFREPTDQVAADGRNALDLERLAQLSGPWNVHFDPRWGGPETVVFPMLVDWTSRPEPGIKYYSGSAVYTREFDWPTGAEKSPSRVFLDLGRLRSLAQVKVNGKDVGTLWTFPFRVEITAALKPGANSLEIRVVNRWPNRMIGDQSLPPEKRLTSTTWNPFKKDSPLVESGLFGPVTIQGEKLKQSSADQ